MRKLQREENALGRPPKPPEERLVTLSVRVPAASLALLNRVAEGERDYLRQRGLPIRGVNQSTAFRDIWELGELEYLLQRVTLWVTRKTNRYSVERAAQILNWRPERLRELLRERGLDVPTEPAPEGAPHEPTTPSERGFDTRFLD
jgi:hypothetical protein